MAICQASSRFRVIQVKLGSGLRCTKLMSCSVLVIALLLFIMADCEAPANLSSFVRVSDDGMRFEVDGAPFFFAGANCYYLMVTPQCL